MSNIIIEVKRKPIKWSNCGFRQVGTILRGLPIYDKEVQSEIESGKTILGGCFVTMNQPQWACKSCGTEFRRTGYQPN